MSSPPPAFVPPATSSTTVPAPPPAKRSEPLLQTPPQFPFAVRKSADSPPDSLSRTRVPSPTAPRYTPSSAFPHPEQTAPAPAHRDHPCNVSTLPAWSGTCGTSSAHSARSLARRPNLETASTLLVRSLHAGS